MMPILSLVLDIDISHSQIAAKALPSWIGKGERTIDDSLSPLMLCAKLHCQQQCPLIRLVRSTLQPHLCQLEQVS